MKIKQRSQEVLRNLRHIQKILDRKTQVTDSHHNPASYASHPEDIVERLSKYSRTSGRGKEEYVSTVKAFYNLITDFCELGWGQSIHFALMEPGVSFKESIAKHEHFLGEATGLKPGMKVLDVGCGIGGPQRYLAGKFGASIVGLNINEYQLGKCSAHNSKAGLNHLCSVLHGDFLNIPAEDESFDAAYHIEALCHSPDKAAAYAEIFRVLRPGAIFTGYDVCTTPLYDSANPEHRELKEAVEHTSALTETASFTKVTDCLKSVGFELLEARDRALDADPKTPWYQPLDPSILSLRRSARTAFVRGITSAVLQVLEGVRAVPRGSAEIHKVINMLGDKFLAAGRLGIITPMYYHKARKPG